MRAHSAVLVVKDWARRSGTVPIAFESYHGEGSDLGPAVMHKVTYVNGEGRFAGDPAYMVHIREAKTEDRTRGSRGSEIDWMEINSTCNRDELTITWNAHDPGSEVREIGYLIVGE